MENLVDSDLIRGILEVYAHEAVRVFRLEVQRAGLEATGEMLNSIRFAAIEKGKDFISAKIEYSEVYRLKDMKSLRYTSIPPASVFEAWVRKKKKPIYFTKIPGYKDNSETVRQFKAGLLSSEDRDQMLDRIAAAMTFYYRRRPNVKRGYRGIYNDPLNKYVLPRFWDDLHQNAGMHALVQFRAIFND